MTLCQQNAEQETSGKPLFEEQVASGIAPRGYSASITIFTLKTFYARRSDINTSVAAKGKAR